MDEEEVVVWMGRLLFRVAIVVLAPRACHPRVISCVPPLGVLHKAQPLHLPAAEDRILPRLRLTLYRRERKSVRLRLKRPPKLIVQYSKGKTIYTVATAIYCTTHCIPKALAISGSPCRPSSVYDISSGSEIKLDISIMTSQFPALAAKSLHKKSQLRISKTTARSMDTPSL